MDRREFLATTGTGAALLSLSTSASAQTRPPGPGAARQVLDITDFGIVAGDDDALAVSNSNAVDKLLAYLLDNSPNRDQLGTAAIKVTIPAGHFRFAKPWVLKQALWIEGQSNSHRFGYATWFDFDTGGFECHGPGTDHGGVLAVPTTGASGYRIENIYMSSRAATGTGHHGIHAVTRGDIIRCTTALFPGHGIFVQAESGFGATNNNANSTRILYCQSGGNGGSGIKLLGGDSNCIVTVACDLSGNGEFGLFDNAFLSNHHSGHHAEGNGLGLVYPGHKITAVSSACAYPIAPWAAGVAIAISVEGAYRVSRGKLYRLLAAGGGTPANAPTHTTEAPAGGVTEADGYRWAYVGTSTSRRYHVALGQTAAASTTVPGTNSAIWVPFEWGGSYPGVPVWTQGMTWKEGGSYCGASQAADTVWEACYTEGSQPPAQVRFPARWIGGQTIPSLWSDCIQMGVNDADGTLYNPGGFSAAKPFHDGGKLNVKFGASLAQGFAMLVRHETLHPNSWIMGGGRDTYFRLDGQQSNYLTFTGPLTNFTGGRTGAQPGAVNIPRLFLGSGAAARNIDYGSAPPASGHHAAGEVVYNTAPAPGGKVGWVCTKAGTPGTWKAFGAIDP